MNVYWERPYKELENKDEATKSAWGMKEYQELNTIRNDGMTFANKTAMWIAYERKLESERPESERLFNDPLAKYFVEPYGKRCSDAFALSSGILFDPKGDIGFGYEGFSHYHAARVKLIGIHIESWLLKKEKCCNTTNSKMIINLGSGCDTRAFWDKGIQQASMYVEVDTNEINDWKKKVLDKIKDDSNLPEPICERQLVSMDFSKESVRDLPEHGIIFDNAATCWILEGLIMYLEEDSIERMFKEITSLSINGSIIILNIMSKAKKHHSADYCNRLLVDELGWKLDHTTYFGYEDFNFGRYPNGKPSNEQLGFTFYSMS